MASAVQSRAILSVSEFTTYSSERSVALMIAHELINEIVKRDAQSTKPLWAEAQRIRVRLLEHGGSDEIRTSQ